MMHPETRLGFARGSVGLGVFAAEDIPIGTVSFAKDSLDIDVSSNHYARLDGLALEGVDRYAYLEPSGNRVLCWDLAKYVNHSCEPNTMSTGWGFEIAIKDIRQGDEITDEYGLLNLRQSMECDCGSSTCRRRVGREDYRTLGDFWDQQVKAAMDSFPRVTQPLLTLLEPATRQELELYRKGIGSYRSVSALL